MKGRARGDFEVKLTPQKPDNREAEAAQIARMSISKRFQGDLKATSQGEMLTIGTNVKGSAGYVAMERIKGSLGGREGTFAVQHNATMNRGNGRLNIEVVPDSGTGELIGITGSMMINIEQGKHSYEFRYEIP